MLSYARELYAAGVDALIIADLGAIKVIREHLPDFELHASTQMSVHNSLGADLAYELGCTRVVLARELTGENIKKVTERCKPEVEVFLHGALCVCHSGQCLFSSMVGGRSGNRGECAQPCRLPYNGEHSYPLSLTDLSLANHIKELCDSGVASLKIEGRMKSPEYVYTVTSIYRRLLDEYREANEEENRALRAAFSRGGFTDGYFTGRISEKMTGTRGEEDKEISRKLNTAPLEIQRKSVSAKAKFALGEPATL
ncbi:MAG: U32 family peptidase, partial [Clostridia bacterium]|nr:U32 family peptidase [Clostridia bacterium]